MWGGGRKRFCSSFGEGVEIIIFQFKPVSSVRLDGLVLFIINKNFVRSVVVLFAPVVVF